MPKIVIYTGLVCEKWILDGENQCLPKFTAWRPHDWMRHENDLTPQVKCKFYKHLGSPNLATIAKFDEIVKIGGCTQLINDKTEMHNFTIRANIGTLPGWGQSHIFRTCPGEPVVRFFREWSNFFRTSIVERLVVILKTTLSPQHMFFVVFNVILIIKTTFNAHNN